MIPLGGDRMLESLLLFLKQHDMQLMTGASNHAHEHLAVLMMCGGKGGAYDRKRIHQRYLRIVVDIRRAWPCCFAVIFQPSTCKCVQPKLHMLPQPLHGNSPCHAYRTCEA